MLMNLNETNNQPDQFGTPQTTEQLAAKLHAMESAGVSLLDRMRVAAEFFHAKGKNSFAKTDSSDSDPHDEHLASDANPRASAHDAGRSAHHARTSAQQARTSGPTSDPDAGGCDPEAGESAPPDPELPPPPKFQFGPTDDLYEIAVDFRAFRDKRSILDHLSDDQRTAIFKLLADYSPLQVSTFLAQSPPAGLGIRVSRRALQRFEKRYKKEERSRASMAFQLECDQLLEAAKTNDQAFLHASERLLKMRLFQITGDPEAPLEEIAKLTEIITSLRKQSLAERKLAAAPMRTGYVLPSHDQRGKTTQIETRGKESAAQTLPTP
jgi:hypothetical protein